MNNDPARQEIVVTDIHMPFGSMVTFMVKWAIASIPALLILVVLGFVFWGVGLGLITSLGSGVRHQPAVTGTTRPGTSTKPQGPTAEEAAYTQNLTVKNVSVGRTSLGEQGVWGEVKNNGERTLREVEITIFCLDSDGKPVFEKTYQPVLVSDFAFGDEGKPLKPGYTRTFGVKLNDAPSDWKGKVEVKITKVQFQS
jgi:hypothetical protein